MADIPDIEIFIEAIRRHPEIWDVSCEKYDKNQKILAWFLIGKQFYPNIEEMSESERNSISKFFPLTNKKRRIENHSVIYLYFHSFYHGSVLTFKKKNITVKCYHDIYENNCMFFLYNLFILNYTY